MQYGMICKISNTLHFQTLQVVFKTTTTRFVSCDVINLPIYRSLFVRRDPSSYSCSALLRDSESSVLLIDHYDLSHTSFIHNYNLPFVDVTYDCSSFNACYILNQRFPTFFCSRTPKQKNKNSRTPLWV